MASGGVETNDSEKISGVVMIFPAADSLSPSSGPPRRLRGRLVDSKTPSTAEEIDAKLKEADHRRQQFYEDLSSKARQKQRILLSYSRESELGQRLQAKLRAAEQKRLSILTNAQMRLSPSGNLKVTIDQAEALPTKLVRYWRRFVRLRGTTYELTKAFASLNINEKSVKQLPFEQLALKIGSDTTLKNGRSLLKRLETRLLTQYAVSNGGYSRAQVENIDHLLNRVASGSQNKAVKIVCRYQVRILLCSYMILGHPDAVLTRKGENETALADSAAKLIQEFELLVEIILGAAIKSVSFRWQLEECDKAWCTYLYHFVVWKTKDAESLEQDLVKAACQLELSMMQACKMTPGGLQGGLKLIQKQVIEDQRLLKAKVKNLTGDTGVKHMEFALSDTRSKFFASKETISPLPSEDGPPVSVSSKISSFAGNDWLGGVAHDPSSSKEVVSPSSSVDGSMPLSENEILVNEIVHEHHNGHTYNLDDIDHDQNGIKVKVKETMEKAFWGAIMDSVQIEKPDYTWVLKLMTEVRDELCEISPSSWKQEIIDTIDLDILSEVLGSGMLDTSYLGRVIEFAFNTLKKLSAPAKEDELEASYQQLVKELTEVSQSQSLSAIALIKGLRFVLQQLQALKKEISKARIKLIYPFIGGAAGLEYMQKAFTSRYGPPSDACKSLPLTMSWLSSVNANNEHPEYMSTHSQGLPSTALRTGGNVSAALNISSTVTSTIASKQQPECRGERIDLLVRLGLLKLVCGIQGLTLEDLPETPSLNLSRLRSVQHQLQKIIVISTSVLVVRESVKLGSTAEMEKMICECTKRLSESLDTVEDAGIADILDTSFNEPSDSKGSLNREMAANALAKSLQAGDAVFAHVSRVVYLGMRRVIMGGTGTKARELAKRDLQRIGAASLAYKLAQAVEVLLKVATVSKSVHTPWYEELVNKI